MSIVDFYQYTLTDILTHKLPTERLILPSNFKYIDSTKVLYDIGCSYNNCLSNIDKLKYYTYCSCTKNWNVYLVTLDNMLLLTTITTAGCVIEVERIDKLTSNNINLNKINYRNLILSQLSDVKFDKITNIQKKPRSIHHELWNIYKFKGIKEGDQIETIKALNIEKDADIIYIHISNPDQINNKLHKQHVAYRVNSGYNIYITDELNMSDEDSFKTIELYEDIIHIKDVYRGDIRILDIKGYKVK